MENKKLVKVKDISVIIPLYKTPIHQLEKFKQYHGLRLFFLSQEPDSCEKKYLKKILKKNFTYYTINKNIGLARASNFLLSKVKTKYCLFTQADVEINFNSIILLKLALINNKDFILSNPRFVKKIYHKKITLKKKIRIKKKNNFNAACFLFDVSKMKKLGFFDEDFFLYWEDIFLLKKLLINQHQILYVKDALAVHESARSTKFTFKIFCIRRLNFKFGEYLYDYKLKKFRFIKILRDILTSPIYMITYLFTFQFKKFLIKLLNLLGILKFILFYIKKKKITKINEKEVLI